MDSLGNEILLSVPPVIGATMHPNAHLIKGVVCGYRIEEIEDEFELYRQCRQMEKLIDELARGRKMEKILRKEKASAK